MPFHLLLFLKRYLTHAPPLTGAPPSNLGGSQIMEAQSSPTPVHLTFSGGSGTSERKITVCFKNHHKSINATNKPGESCICYPVKLSLTHNLQKQHSLVLSSGIGDGDGVVALVISLCSLYDKAAEVFPGLHSHTAFSLCDWLTHRTLKSLKYHYH